jgi:hypothetical protein
VNPSLTITALAERAMSFIPPATETGWNDKAENDNARNDAASVAPQASR